MNYKMEREQNQEYNLEKMVEGQETKWQKATEWERDGSKEACWAEKKELDEILKLGEGKGQDELKNLQGFQGKGLRKTIWMGRERAECPKLVTHIWSLPAQDINVYLI